ncbi:MAG: hypothetical protein Q8Q36_01640 [bacterium]|nr:hypothetical protein [bacterium]
MQFDRESYRSVKPEQKNRVAQLKNLTQSDWIKACKKLGLYVSVGNGKGSHVAVYKSADCSVSDSSCLVLTIVKDCYPNIQLAHFKKILAYGLATSLYNEDTIWDALGIK